MLPRDFENIMKKQLGEEEAQLLCDALELSESPTSLRINRSKMQDYSDITNIKSFVPWCKDGLYLHSRPSFTFDPLFHAGCYYVQEASSMYLSHLINEYVGEEPVVALDMCAAPGGKSTLAISQLPEGSILVANEVVRQRAQILSENITKWGNPNVIVTSNYAEQFLPLGELFDLIICDAPCSGEGMFRKDKRAIDEWSMDNVETCWRKQRDIIYNIWQCLKPNGLFIYSTCTFNNQENENNVTWIINELGGERLPLQDKEEWNIIDGHFFPHKTVGEGFYISAIRKNTNEHFSRIDTKKKRNSRKSDNTVPKEIKEWIIDSDKFSFLLQKNSYFAFPKQHDELFTLIKESLEIISGGIEIATTKGKILQPAHSLAVSTQLKTDIFPMVEISLEQAISYLRTEAIRIENAPIGYIILSYKGHPLGFGKNIGSRVNNLYPNEWRIRSTYSQ